MPGQPHTPPGYKPCTDPGCELHAWPATRHSHPPGSWWLNERNHRLPKENPQ